MSVIGLEGKSPWALAGPAMKQAANNRLVSNLKNIVDPLMPDESIKRRLTVVNDACGRRCMLERMSTRVTEILTAALFALFLTTSTAARAQLADDAPLLRSVPGDAVIIEAYYKQTVYDTADNKIGEVADLLVDKDGLIRAAMLSVGGFLGLASKYVAAPFNALQLREREHKPYIVLDVTKLALERAPGFRFNRSLRTWEPADTPQR
jgi:hypothetical protein